MKCVAGFDALDVRFESLADIVHGVTHVRFQATSDQLIWTLIGKSAR